MNILLINGSRSDWGYFRPVIDAFRLIGIKPSLLHCNMAVLQEYGGLTYEVEKDGYLADYRVNCAYAGDNHYASAKMIGSLLSSIADILNNGSFDWILLAGDRPEQLAAAVTASQMYVPIAHIQAGERSGNIDGITRHAISKLAHVHFAANAEASQRLIAMGEEPWRVKNTGAPQLDELFHFKENPHAEFLVEKNIKTFEFVLFSFHSVTEEYGNIEASLKNLEGVIDSIEEQIIFISPNNDAGSARFMELYHKKRKINDLVFSNVQRQHFLQLMYFAKYMIGNSSASILEAPVFKTPAINIGRRQKDRTYSSNVLNADNCVYSVQKAISYLMKNKLHERKYDCKSIYGDEPAAEKIVSTLIEFEKSYDKNQLLSRDITC